MPNDGRSSSPHEKAKDDTSSFAQQVNTGGILGDQDTQTTFCSSGSSSSEDENSTAPTSPAEKAATSERRTEEAALAKSLLGGAGDDRIVSAGTDFSSLEHKSNKNIIFPVTTMNDTNDTDSDRGQGSAIASPLDGQGEFSADGFPLMAPAKPLTPPPNPPNDVPTTSRAAVGCPVGASSGAPSALTGQHPPPPPATAPSTPYQYSDTTTGRVLTTLSKLVRPSNAPVHSGSALAGFLALLLVTAANYMLGPMRDAAALAVGVEHIPTLTLASTVLAIASSVPIGWLFEAPDPMRKKLWRKMGLTRGETQGTSLALFYRLFAGCLVSYALGFKLVEIVGSEEGGEESLVVDQNFSSFPFTNDTSVGGWSIMSVVVPLQVLYAIGKAAIKHIVASKFGKLFYVAFFLVVHLMKLHSLSLIWGVTTEALEYEEQAETREKKKFELEAAATRQRELARSGGKQQSQSATTPRSLRPRLSTIPSGQIAYGEKEPALAAAEETKNKKKGDAGQASGTTSASGGDSDGADAPSLEGRSKARLKRLAFVGFGGTLGGISGSVIASMAAHVLHLSGLLLVAAIMLEMSAELSIELGRIMQRHWEEQNRIRSYEDLTALGRNADTSPHSGGSSKSEHGVSRSIKDEDKDGEEDLVVAMKRVSSSGSMKRVASGNSLYGEMRKSKSLGSLSSSGRNKTGTGSFVGVSQHRAAGGQSSVGNATVAQTEECTIDDNSFRQRLLRGITTILRSRLLMAIFTYNALYASTSVLLSFQRAELVANRSSAQESNSAESDTAFLAKINMASSVAVFVLQASGLGAYIAHSAGQRGTLALIPIIRLFGVLLLAWWHVQADGEPPNLLLFLVLDELTKVVNFAVAKPVRESLWRGLSNEARYEAKPIVDTLANRWGGGSAAFCVSLVNRVIDFTHLGERSEDGTRTLLGFPPVLFLCVIVAAWWAMVSADLGHIRHRIDLELKKLQ